MRFLEYIKNNFFIDKNLENNCKYHLKNFTDKKYINVFSLKDILINDKTYNSIIKSNNSNEIVFLNNYIYDTLFSVINLYNETLIIMSHKKRNENSFNFNIQIELKNFKKGFICLKYFPSYDFSSEQISNLNKIFLKDFYLISPLLSTNNTYANDGQNVKNKYSNLKPQEAIELAYQNLIFSLDTYVNDLKYNEIKAKRRKF